MLSPPATKSEPVSSHDLKAVSWNDCVINAEDCRIKAVQQPDRREEFLNAARRWDALAATLDGQGFSSR